MTFPWLKFLVVRHWSALGTALLIVTAAWRPVAGGIRALIALRIHDWAALDVIDRDHARYQPNRRREIWSAAIGAGVVVVTLALTAVSVKLVPLLPGPWAPLGRLVNDLLIELAFAVLSLIRPCLSLGARRPIHAALVAFSRRPVGFFVWHPRSLTFRPRSRNLPPTSSLRSAAERRSTFSRNSRWSWSLLHNSSSE